MKKTTQTVAWIVILGLLTTIFTGCSLTETHDHDTHDHAVDVRLLTEASSAAAKAPIDSLVLTTVKFLVREVKFHSATEDSLDFSTNTLVANLTPGQTAHEMALAEIEPGTYKRISFRVHKPDETESIPDPDFREGTSGNDRYSVIIAGTLSGAPFTLKLNKGFQVKVNANFTIEDEMPDLDVTIEAAVYNWFLRSDGSFIDPFSDDAIDEIEDNIKDSFRQK